MEVPSAVNVACDSSVQRAENVAEPNIVNGAETPRKKAKTDDVANEARSSMSRDSLPSSRASSRGPTPPNGGVLGTLSTMASAPASASDIVGQFVELVPIPKRLARIEPLAPHEVKELESALEMGNGNTWKDDWAGNLAFADEEIANPRIKTKDKKPFKQPFLEWAKVDTHARRLLFNLMRHVHHMPDTPSAAKALLATADGSSAEAFEKVLRQISVDPLILEDDGWTTVRSSSPVGATGGPHLIGQGIRWDHSDAIVIAYIHDPDIGDLWKAIWTEGDDKGYAFDIEAEELVSGRRQWERKRASTKPGSGHYGKLALRPTVNDNFFVKEIESGIVLAASYGKGARPGVYWPARVMNASETKSQSQSKRSAAKQKLNVVFLAPYWDSTEQQYVKSRKVEPMSESADFAFGSAPLLQIETIDATEEMIQEYPFDPKDGLDRNQIETAFKFTGLPKATLKRYFDSHRLALALKKYAAALLQNNTGTASRAGAGLFEIHPMAVRAPLFPDVVLHLPLSYILSQTSKALDVSNSEGSIGADKEPVIDLASIIKAMSPPASWGQGAYDSATSASQQNGSTIESRPATTPNLWLAPTREVTSARSLDLDVFLNGLVDLKQTLVDFAGVPGIAAMVSSFQHILKQVSSAAIDDPTTLTSNERMKHLRVMTGSWAILKSQGDEALSCVPLSNAVVTLAEWRRACERLYKYITSYFGGAGAGNGLSVVMTDIRCNGHRTANGCFERSVRLPAAIKAAKLAGAAAEGRVRLVTSVAPCYTQYVEKRLLHQAHSVDYLKRMKARCSAAQTASETFPLTEDSDGNGGGDTSGSKGTWQAAVVGVAAAVAAVEMVVCGECVNAFCATRPPGHHAGRGLHPMKAVSNGFCVLNAVACAAIHAATPISQGGMGLRRIVVLDFDVHHGNGTQDILCSTYDPRFLYISLHAGGPEVNGVDMEDDPDHELHDLAGRAEQNGIYPGRCGDTSPNKGVLNIPLGAKVTSHAMGTALLQAVSPAVDDFTPDLIILSAGFDAHKNDPMNLGALSAEDFGTITEVACQLAFRSCSGRIVSVLEGGYSVPCCRPQADTFVPSPRSSGVGNMREEETLTQSRPQPTKVLDLGEDLPDDMDDQVPYALQRRLEKCHAEGFVECVREHVKCLKRCNRRA